MLRIAQLSWRLQRLSAAEAQLFSRVNRSRQAVVASANAKRLAEHQAESVHYRYRAEHPNPPEPQPLPPDLPAEQILCDFVFSYDDKTNPLLRLQRYESALERSLHKSLQELRRLQSQPLPDEPSEPEEPQAQNEPTAPPEISDLNSLLLLPSPHHKTNPLQRTTDKRPVTPLTAHPPTANQQQITKNQ